MRGDRHWGSYCRQCSGSPGRTSSVRRRSGCSGSPVKAPTDGRSRRSTTPVMPRVGGFNAAALAGRRRTIGFAFGERLRRVERGQRRLGHRSWRSAQACRSRPSDRGPPVGTILRHRSTRWMATPQLRDDVGGLARPGRDGAGAGCQATTVLVEGGPWHGRPSGEQQVDRCRRLGVSASGLATAMVEAPVHPGDPAAARPRLSRAGRARARLRRVPLPLRQRGRTRSCKVRHRASSPCRRFAGAWGAGRFSQVPGGGGPAGAWAAPDDPAPRVGCRVSPRLNLPPSGVLAGVVVHVLRAQAIRRARRRPLGSPRNLLTLPGGSPRTGRARHVADPRS